MTDSCLAPGEIGFVLALPADDPRRRHLDGCPDCRALARAYGEFMAPSAEALPPWLDEADAQLAASLRASLAAPPAARDVTGAYTPGRSSRPRLRRGLLAVAAALVVCAGLFAARDLSLLRATRLPGHPGSERGGEPGVGEPRWSRHGETSLLTWRRPAGAEAAVVVLYDARMRELARRAVGESSSLAIDAGGTTPAAAWAQVLFLAEGDTMARSRIVGVR